MANTLEELAYEEAQRAISGQERVLESIRTRAIALTSVGALVFSLTGYETAGQSDFAVLPALSLTCFILIGLVTVSLLFPRSFIFYSDTRALISEADEDRKLEAPQDVQGVLRDSALWMERHRQTNQRRISRMLRAYQVSLGLLVLEVVALALHRFGV